MSNRRKLALFPALLAALLLPMGCAEKTPAEKAGDAMENAGEAAGEAIEDAGEAVENATEGK